jgi:superfamily II DNA or RNA helicase
MFDQTTIHEDKAPTHLSPADLAQQRKSSRWKFTSAWAKPLHAQTEAASALDAYGKSGMVVVPCGGGKTRILLEEAMKAGRRVLFLTLNRQSVCQLRDNILEHTNVLPQAVHVYTSNEKTQPNLLQSYMITTYSMFSSGCGFKC